MSLVYFVGRTLSGVSTPDRRDALVRLHFSDGSAVTILRDGCLADVREARTLQIYPCGCSRLKVKAGMCDHYAPDRTERP